MIGQAVTQEEINKFFASKIQSELVLPYTWTGHANALENLKQIVDISMVNNLYARLMDRFSVETSAKPIGEKCEIKENLAEINIPQE